MKKWNPHYVAYAKAHGSTPKVRLEKDKETFPGGCMCGFTIWIGRLKRDFYKVRPDCFLDADTIYNHDAWGDFVRHSKLKLDFV